MMESKEELQEFVRYGNNSSDNSSDNHNHEPLICGSRTSRLWKVFRQFSNDQNELQAEKIRGAFHTIDIYPTKSQVYEMVECAGQCNHMSLAGVASICSTPSPSSRDQQTSGRCSQVTEVKRPYITFGEFCIFASQLQKQYKQQQAVGACEPAMMSKVYERTLIEQKRKQRAGSFKSYEVFLGGSCNPTTWRMDTVIPILKEHRITYYNPQVTNWVPEMVELEDQAKQAAQLLLFVIDNQTRSVASVVESAYLIGCGRSVVLVIKPWSEDGDNYVFDEKISYKEYCSLMRGQSFLHDVSEWSECPVFESINVALRCIIKIIHTNSSPDSRRCHPVMVRDLTLADGATPVRHAHLHVGDKLLSVREAFDSIRSTGSDHLIQDDLALAFRSVTNHILQSPLPATITDLGDMITFDHFCSIVTEYNGSGKQQSAAVSDNYRLVVGKQRGVGGGTGDVDDTLVWRCLCWLFMLLMLPLTSIYRLLGLLVAPGGSVGVSTPHRLAHPTPPPPLTPPPDTRDVYLGGNLDGAWRDQIAIPLLLKHGVTYYNAEQCIWTNRLLPLESVGKYRSRLLLFVISARSRALAAMTEAAYHIGQGCQMVLCVQHLSAGTQIDGETVSRQAVKDYNRGRTYLADMANREGVPVFEDVAEAVQCSITRVRGGHEQAGPGKMGKIKTY